MSAKESDSNISNESEYFQGEMLVWCFTLKVEYVYPSEG